MTSTTAHDFSGLSVLVADDEEINCLLTEVILRQSGFAVTIVANGAEALAAAGAGCFDIILMDIQMPVMDGLEACSRLRLLEKETVRPTPIIAMTANDNDSFRQQCLAHGFNDYIAKPFKSRDLLTKIAGQLTSGRGA